MAGQDAGQVPGAQTASPIAAGRKIVTLEDGTVVHVLRLNLSRLLATLQIVSESFASFTPEEQAGISVGRFSPGRLVALLAEKLGPRLDALLSVVVAQEHVAAVRDAGAADALDVLAAALELNPPEKILGKAKALWGRVSAAKSLGA